MSQQQTVLRVTTNIPGQISGSTTYEYLDLYSDIPIKINKSFAELQDISKRNSDYSIGLQLPGSKKNNKFFESYFNVDASSLYFNATLRVPCDVLLNDQSYFRGYLRLNKVNVQNSKVEYDVTLYSTVGDLFGKIGNNLLKDLNFDANVNGYGYQFNHEFTSQQVRSQMGNWAWGQDMEPLYFYPITHNGYNYSGDTVNLSGSTSGQTRLYTSTIVGSYANYAAAYAAGVKRYRLNSPEDGLLDNQLKPALNIKGLITLMFQQYGYTIKSDFFNTPWFRMLYIYLYFSSEATTFSYKVPPKSDTASNQLAAKLTETYVDTTDPVCHNIKTTRTYHIQLVNNSTGEQAISDVPINLVLNFKEYPCGQTYGYNTFSGVTIPAYATGTTFTWVSNEFVPCPSACKLRYTQNFGINNYRSDIPQYDTTPPGQIVYIKDYDKVDFSKVIDWNLKQIDILSSIAKKFNLVFLPDPDVPNQIIIEPYTYYIGTGNVYDWTDKLSFDKGFTVEPALNYVESELILTDQEDGDYGNKSFKDQNNRIYGENKVYNTTDFKSQSKKIDTLFSPQMLRQWDTNDTAPNGQIKLPLGINYAANSSSSSSGGNEKIVWTYPGVKTKPKLFYLVGSFNPFLDVFGEVLNYSGYVLTNAVYVAQSDGTPTSGRYTIPIVSHTMPIGNTDTNKINNDTISVLFNSEYPTAVGTLTGDTYNVYTNNDAYQLFYSNRVNNLYNANTRFLNGFFDLKLSDIQNLRANDLIKINEQYFTWNKIDNFNLTNRELTKVELIQYNSYVNEYPKRYFQYYYCDNPSKVYKFETDFTNPSLSGTCYGWSTFYDYNIGILLTGVTGSVSGFTSCVRDFSQASGDGYIPYTIYEVDETTYNNSGISRQYDSLYNYLINHGLDLDPGEWPSYIYAGTGSTKFLMNLFIDCTNFNSFKTTYGITTGSSTYHGTIVTPTPTPTATPSPTPIPSTGMTGSLLMTFDEIIAGRGDTYYQVFVNGLFRDVHYTETNNLYSTNINVGDVVTVAIINNSTTGETYTVVRRDYTTDDTLGEMGVVDTTLMVFSGGTGATLVFTATTLNASSYNFEYRVTASLGSPLPNTCIWNQNDNIWSNNAIYWSTCTNYPVLVRDGCLRSTAKLACICSGGGQNAYYSGNTYGVGTTLYSNPTLTTPLGSGYWNDYVNVYVITNGTLTSIDACPACLEDPKTINWRMDYSYSSDNATGFTITEMSIANYPVSGNCYGGYSAVNYYTPATYINYSGLTGSTSWSGSTSFDGQTTGLRNLVVKINSCYQPKDWPTIKRSITYSNFKLYKNNVFVTNAIALSPQYGAYNTYNGTVPQCTGMTAYTNFYVDFGSVTINENDNIKIVITDQYYTPWNKNQFEYIWSGSSTNTRYISGYTFGDGYYVPNYSATVTGTTGSYLTPINTATLPLSSAQLFFRISNSGATDTITTRTIKLFQDGIEQTGYTITQTGMTVPITPSYLLRYYTNWPASVGQSQITNKWQITDVFAPIPPTPTPTPTMTPTPTPTATPSYIAPTFQYKYVATSNGSTVGKAVTNMSVTFNNGNIYTYSRNNITWTSSANNTSPSQTMDVGVVGTDEITIRRDIMKTASGTVILDDTKWRILVNGVQVATYTNTANRTVPFQPTTLSETYTFNNVVIGSGDLVVIEVTDTQV